MTSVRLYQKLSKQFGEEMAEDITTFIRDDVKEEFESRRDVYATKVDLGKEVQSLRNEIAETKLEIIKRSNRHFTWFVSIFITITIAVSGTVIGLLLNIISHLP